MANEVSHRHSATGETLYFTIRNTARQMWNTAGTPNFETLAVANWGDYDVALSESPASSYFYVGTFPAISGNMVAGRYWVDIFKRAGGSPAISDVLQASYFGYWDGTTFKFWDADATHVGGTLQTGGDLATLITTLTGYVDTEMAAVLAAVDTEVAAIKAKTDQLTFTSSAYVQADVINWKTATAPAMTGDAFARLGAPAGASVSADVAGVLAAVQAITESFIRGAIGMSSANLDTQLAAIAGYLDTEIAAILAAVDTEVAAIKAKTDNLPADPADASDIATSFASITSLINGLNNLSQANVRTALGMASANLDTQLAAISALIDTEMAATLAAVDTEVAAIKAKTDQFAFTNAGKVDASLQAAGDVVAAVCNKLADHMRRRTQASVFASSDGDALNLLSLYGMIQQLQKSGPMSGGSLPVKNPDGTALGTLTFTSDPAAEPVTGVTP